MLARPTEITPETRRLPGELRRCVGSASLEEIRALVASFLASVLDGVSQTLDF